MKGWVKGQPGPGPAWERRGQKICDTSSTAACLQLASVSAALLADQKAELHVVQQDGRTHGKAVVAILFLFYSTEK